MTASPSPEEIGRQAHHCGVGLADCLLQPALAAVLARPGARTAFHEGWRQAEAAAAAERMTRLVRRLGLAGVNPDGPPGQYPGEVP